MFTYLLKPVYDRQILTTWKGTAQFAERSTEKPGAILTRVPVPGPAKDFSPRVNSQFKLQALVYDILPSTTVVVCYVIASWKLSANERFFVGAQTVVSLSQTIKIKQRVSFVAANKVYNSTNKTTIVWIETELFFSLFFFFLLLFFTRGGCTSCLRGCVGTRLLPLSY